MTNGLEETGVADPCNRGIARAAPDRCLTLRGFQFGESGGKFCARFTQQE
jgi:hypothetical protein